MVEDGGLDGCKKRDGDVQDALSLEDEVRSSDRLIRLFWQVLSIYRHGVALSCWMQ